MRNEFYSNCFVEMLKAKLRNPAIKVMYLPAFLNEVSCPHWMWLDDDGEHDFHFNGRLPWWKWLWHKGYIRTVHRGCYKGCIDQMIEKKYYSWWNRRAKKAEYIKRKAAIKAAKHVWAKGLEPSQYIEALPAADVQGIKERIAMDIERYGDCKVVSIVSDRGREEQMTMEGD